MTEEEIVDELKIRIRADINHFDGNLPERYSIAWHGYLAGLYEWKVITLGFYRGLTNTLPAVEEPNVIAEIFAGRDDDDD